MTEPTPSTPSAPAASSLPADAADARDDAVSHRRSLLDDGGVLAHLADARVQKAYLQVLREEDPAVPPRFNASLQLFAGQKVWLHVDVHGVAVADERDDAGVDPPAAQKLLREHLMQTRLRRAEQVHSSLLQLTFHDVKGRVRSLFVEQDPRDPRLLLTAGLSDDEQAAHDEKQAKKNRKKKGRQRLEGKADAPAGPAGVDAGCVDAARVDAASVDIGVEKILLQVGKSRPSDGRDVRRGKLYQAPQPVQTAPAAPASSPSTSGAPRKKAKQKDRFQTLRAHAKQTLKKQLRLKANLEADLARHGDPDHHARCGEWFKTVMSRTPRGTRVVEVYDFEGRPQTLELAVDKNAKENLELFFKRKKRADQAHAHIPPRLQGLVERIADVRALRETLSPEALAVLDDDAKQQLFDDATAALQSAGSSSARRRAALAGPRRPWRAFRSSDGTLYRVGRSAKDNDDLTFHHTPGNDWWVHSRGLPGSHVVFSASGDAPSEPQLLDAAHLAMWFSPLKNEERADVQWTQRKYVRKPAPGAPAGFVHLSNERVFHVRLERKRLQALLDGEEPAK